MTTEQQMARDAVRRLQSEIDLRDIDIAALNERPGNPNHMATEQFDLLVAAIKKSGFLQPVLVRPLPAGGGFEIIDGAHRVRAAREAGLKTIPCVVIESEEAEAILLQIGMNRLRGELDLSSVARALAALEADADLSREALTLSGYGLAEIDELLKTLEVPDDVMLGAVGGEQNAAPSDEEGSTGTFIVEVVFGAKKDAMRAKRRLKKLGKGDLAVGLDLALNAADAAEETT